MIFYCTVILFSALSNCYCFKLKGNVSSVFFCVCVASLILITWLTYSLVINVGIPPVEIAQDNDLKPHGCHFCCPVPQKNVVL